MEIMSRLHPIVFRYVIGLSKREGEDVAFSVVVNIALILMTSAAVTIDDRDGDVNRFLNEILSQVERKFSAAKDLKGNMIVH
jgi:hypothetical protein